MLTVALKSLTSIDHPQEERMLIKLLGSASSQGSSKADLLLLLLISWTLQRRKGIYKGRGERRELWRRNKIQPRTPMGHPTIGPPLNTWALGFWVKRGGC